MFSYKLMVFDLENNLDEKKIYILDIKILRQRNEYIQPQEINPRNLINSILGDTDKLRNKLHIKR